MQPRFNPTLFVNRESLLVKSAADSCHSFSSIVEIVRTRCYLQSLKLGYLYKFLITAVYLIPDNLMPMASESGFLLFLSALLCHLLAGSAGATGTYAPINLSSLLPSTVCSPPRGMSHSGRLTVVSRTGPCSPFPAGEGPNTRQILLQDRARVKFLQSLIAARQRRAQPLDSLAESSTPVRYGIESFDTNNYIVKVGFGTPTSVKTLVFDTGSDLTWIRCEPCSSEDCSRLKESVFDPAKSSSFLDISCNSADCSEFKSSVSDPNPGCTSSFCDYKVDYKDNSMSSGSVGSDTITLTPTISVPQFRFGCSHNTSGKFGTTSGVLGLGPGKVSLVSQSEAQLGKVFSYYLPEQPSSTGFLSFAPEVSADVKFTPLLYLDNPSFYFVDLMQIKVGDGILPVSGSISTAGGTLFDSGTVITRLPPDAYAVLKSTFRQAMANFTLVAPEDDLLDTCYDFSGYDLLKAVPSMALVFNGGVQLDIVVSGILYGTSKSRMCLAFARNSDPTDYIIIGNKVQRGYEVIYDVGKRRLGFKVIDHKHTGGII